LSKFASQQEQAHLKAEKNQNKKRKRCFGRRRKIRNRLACDPASKEELQEEMYDRGETQGHHAPEEFPETPRPYWKILCLVSFVHIKLLIRIGLLTSMSVGAHQRIAAN
jgi:hypothetical protein